MKVDMSDLVQKLRAFGESNERVGKYEPATLSEEDLAYLDSLKLPPDLDAFYRQHSPTRTMVGSEARLLTLKQIRAEHEEAEPGMTLRALGACVLMTTVSGNVYFCVKERKGKGYRILFGDHEQIGEDEEDEEPLTPETLPDACPPEPSLRSLAEMIEAFAADVLPNSPYVPERKKAFVAWKKARG